ncbi:hypothetical protein [Rhodohalobacter mucosus]|uniref:PH domain-containing protein n=1 Tax=Rhodohalobacter mucosus TaxID=2079485 RepID=A0A316TN54_9BACT|nr:hypothetical protein [Rhodohalobacter mucosus]PWN05081.1 hypothetical protein DDZ15_16110 [Rhodohalobacter mucosus]
MGYRHTQTGYFILSLMIPAIIFLIAVYLNGVFGEAEKVIIQLTIVLMSVATIIFSSLTVKVNEDEIVWYFGPGLWKYRIKLSEVKNVSKGHSHPLEGIGIRWNPWKGMLYNVSGLQNVEILRKDGKTTRIGTDEPDKLVKTIQDRL